MPPQLTAIAKAPADFAAWMSNGESPTYADSARRPSEALDSEKHGVGIRFVPLRVFVGDHDVEVGLECGEAVESKGNGTVPLRRDDPELPALGLESGQEREQLVERLERLVQPVVVLLVRLEQLICTIGVDGLHLRDDALAADRQAELLGRNLAPEHGPHRVLHRREDDRPRVDERAVEVEEDDGKAHRSIVARAFRHLVQ